MIFRQLFDPQSSTFTYLLADESTREAVLIDPVFEQLRRDAALLNELGLKLRWTLETHIHADHVTGAWLLKQRLGTEALEHRLSVVGSMENLPPDVGIAAYRVVQEAVSNVLKHAHARHVSVALRRRGIRNLSCLPPLPHCALRLRILNASGHLVHEALERVRTRGFEEAATVAVAVDVDDGLLL